VSTGLSSARSRALGNDDLCRVPDLGHSANMWHTACPHFAECWPSAKNGTRHTEPLSSAGRRALGKDRSRAQHAPAVRRPSGCLTAVILCRVLKRWHSAKRKLRRVSMAGTRQSLFRQVTSSWHSANSFYFFLFKFFYNQLKFEKLIPGSI